MPRRTYLHVLYCISLFMWTAGLASCGRDAAPVHNTSGTTDTTVSVASPPAPAEHPDVPDTATPAVDTATQEKPATDTKQETSESTPEHTTIHRSTAMPRPGPGASTIGRPHPVSEGGALRDGVRERDLGARGASGNEMSGDHGSANTTPRRITRETQVSSQQPGEVVTTMPESSVPAPDNTHSQHAAADTASIEQASKSATVGIARKAELGYNYQPKMERGATQVITAMVKIKAGKNDHPLRLALDQIITDENRGIERKDDSTFVYPQEMRVYQYLTLKLTDVTGEVKIDSEDISRQELDTAQGNIWRWNITTNTVKPEVTLRLQVFGEQRNGQSGYLPAVSLPIKIFIKPAYGREVETHLLDKPEVLWTAIVGIAGFLAWLIKYLVQRRKKGAADTEEDGKA